MNYELLVGLGMQDYKSLYAAVTTDDRRSIDEMTTVHSQQNFQSASQL